MKKKRIAALGLALVMALSACSSAPAQTPEESTTKESVSQEQTPEATPEATVEEDAVQPLEGEIVFWTMWNDTEPQGEAWQEVADRFMALYPNTKITIQWCGRDISKTLKPALESGQRIDMFDYPTQYSGQLGFYCLDLSEMIEQPFDVLGGQSISDVVLPSMLETPKKQTNTWAGQIAVGYKPWLNLFMYNAAAFEEAGITSNPTTWDELDAACAKLLEAGYVPITFDDAYAHWIAGMYLQRLKGQDWVIELAADTTGEMWNDPAVLQFAQAFEDFAQKGYLDSNVGGNKWPAGQMDVGSGKVAMYYNLTGLPVEVSDVAGPDFKWGAFNYPDVPGGESYDDAAPAGCTMTAISSGCENVALAAEFLAFIHSQESDDRFVESGMTTSSKTGSWPEALTDVKPVFDEISVILQTGGGIETNPEIKPVFTENFIKLAAGQISADKFVENMVAAAQQ